MFVNPLATRLLLSCALFATSLVRAEVVNVYTSANFAPLMLGDGRGLYPDLITRLNQHSAALQNKLKYKLYYLPRKRLQVKLEDGSLDGIVIGMMPQWLDDPQQRKYKWTAPFATDRFALVSLGAKPVDPAKPSLLRGTIGVTASYVYPGLEDWFARAAFTRLDSVSDEVNIEKLLLGQVDCVLVAESMARYFERKHHLGSRLHIVPMPGSQTERRFTVQLRDARLFEPVSEAVRTLKTDPTWRKMAAAYE